MNTFKWIGHEKTYLDEIHVEKCGPLSIGLYGGNQDVGADTEKREDAVLAWCDPQLDFEFVMIFDAHHKAKNIHFIIEEICERKEKLQELFAYPVNLAFHHTHMYLLALFTDEAFIQKCEQENSETACLICLRKGEFLYWLSVGECFAYLFQPEQLQNGKGRLNQRKFYECIGRENAFSANTSCFTSGVRELPNGMNHIVMVTDGVVECGQRTFDDDQFLYEALHEENQLQIERVLKHVQEWQGRDCATIIGWSIDTENRDCAH
ncbi:protein phosphatase 2C domain-containing protein [Bacillus sp. DX4.1]|uniref:protein phosphatase 2C domain-containing protein n=1 Tax=Bacillus sp. DX4.1 TaxID=3055867 RepID=UPI0025A02245|nr:protein phosphatase 2C domain-containing protein [Bacillus sp. DX4.1]MDM5187966.1 protein phosphatase 2C domain-containing protein [Bacillus sp. DX4.1]